jgi:nucleoside-diphosphate-sugar epimerase
MAKVAVTGGAGFLGSHIAKRLISEGNEVTIIDDFSAGSLQNLKDVGIDQKVAKGDLKSHDFARSALQGAETVFHFAAEVGSVDYLHGSKGKELAAMQANLLIDTNVFRACLEAGVTTIIYASSVSVYPFDQQQGQRVQFREKDSDSKVNPEGGYGWSKYLAEKQLAYMPEVASGVARIFHAYGKNIYLRPDRSQVIGSLMRKAIEYPKEEFVVWGDGMQRRCFVHVDDVLDALWKLTKYVQKKGSITVNVGSTEEYTIMELAKLIINTSGKKIPMKLDPFKPSGALNRMPDLAFVFSTLGWRPKTPFANGIKSTYDWAVERVQKGLNRP